MKFFSLTALLLVITLASNAQTEKGTVNVNGLFGLNNGSTFQSNPSFNQFSLNLNPNIGYLVGNNWEVGVGFRSGISRFQFKEPLINFPNSTALSRQFDFGAHVYTRYYFGTGNVKPFAFLAGGYNRSNFKSVSPQFTSVSSSRYFNTEGGVGLMWFASKKVGLFSQTGYNRQWGGSMDRGSINLNFGVQINLGKGKK